MIVTTQFLTQLLGQQRLISSGPIYLRFDQILDLYKKAFPHLDLGDATTQAVHALAFVSSVKSYMVDVGGKRAKRFFERHKDEFLKYLTILKYSKKLSPTTKCFFFTPPMQQASKF